MLHDKGDKIAPLGDIYTEPASLGGLTAFGASVVKECNRLGIVVDLAHASHETVPAALKVSTQPMIVSHTSLDTRPGSNPRMAKMMAPRLISKDHARVVTEAGGVIGVWTKLSDSLEEYVGGIKAMVDAVGIDHVGIGSDTDIQVTPDRPIHQRRLARSFRRILQSGSCWRRSARASRPARSARSAAGTSAGFLTR